MGRHRRLPGHDVPGQRAGIEAAGLRIYLLGSPEATWAGQPLVIPRRQARALLYRLAAHAQPVPRETLCFLFWPDRPESTARRNLSHLLTHLRRALPAPEVLAVVEDQVGLDPRCSWSDTVAFEQLTAERGVTAAGDRMVADEYTRAEIPRVRPDGYVGTPVYARNDRGSAAYTRQHAVALYRGPFLAGFSLPESPEFEAWVTREQRAFEQLYLEVLGTLLDERMAQGEYEAAITCARQYLAADDQAEDVHRRLIELYAITGNRSAALRQFERCAAILERELGVSPLPATRAVYQAVLAGRLPPPTSSTTRPTAAVTALAGLDGPLIGREEAWSALEDAYERTRAGRGQVVLISGEPGIGKSRLMQDLAAHLQAEALVLASGSQPEERTLPYQPIAQALRSVLHVECLAHVQPIWLAEVARLVPELRTLRPDLPLPLPAEPDGARTRLFEALCQIVLGLAAGPRAEAGRQARPVLLCLDDLNWADSATLDWLGFLGHRLSDHRLLVLGTYRSDEASAVDGLRRALARAGVLSEVVLVGLDKASVLRILRHVTGPRPHDETLAERLQQATGGNPFFLVETLRALSEAGQQPEELADLETLPLPDIVRQAVKARLDHLSPQARQVLEAGAILGEPFGFDLVHLTAGRGELETVDGLEMLVARQLLAEEVGEPVRAEIPRVKPDGYVGTPVYARNDGGSAAYNRPAGYRFQHDLIRRATEAGLSPVRRQLLHRRAGRMLERLTPDAVAAMAHHFDEGGAVAKALHYHGLAAQRAEALFAWEEAEKHQSRMLALLDLLDPGCERPDRLAQRGRVLASRAHQRYLQGRLAERDADLAALAALAAASGDEGLHLAALMHQARYLNLDARYEEAIGAATEGIELAKRLDDVATHSRLLAQVGFAHYFLGQPRPALAALESALAAVAEEANAEADAESRGRITHILGYVYFHLGDYVRSLACQQEAYTCHQQVGDHNRVAWDGLDIGAVYLELGRRTEAEQYLTEHLALARRIGARPAEAYGLTLLGSWGLHQGHYATAVDYFQRSFSIQQDLHSEHGCVASMEGTGFALYHLGDLAQAQDWLARACATARAIGHRRRLAEALICLGLVETAAGQFPAAHRHLSEAVAIARDSECRESLAAGLAGGARAERQGGDPASALAHACEAVRVAQESDLPVCEMWGEMEVGLALWAQGEFMAASEHTGRAAALVPQAHEGWIGTEEVYRAHAWGLCALGRAEAADEQARQAEVIVESKAAHILDPEVRQRYLQFARSPAR